MLYNTLKSIIKQKIDWSNIYNITPLQPAFPYIVINITENANWENLVHQGIKSRICCELYNRNFNLSNMLKVINQVRNAIISNQLGEDIIYLRFSKYNVKRQKLTLTGKIYFNSLTIV